MTIAVNRNLSNCEKTIFFGLFRNCLNCDSLRWSHTHFICIPVVHIISFCIRYVFLSSESIKTIIIKTIIIIIPSSEKGFEGTTLSHMLKKTGILAVKNSTRLSDQVFLLCATKFNLFVSQQRMWQTPASLCCRLNWDQFNSIHVSFTDVKSKF